MPPAEAVSVEDDTNWIDTGMYRDVEERLPGDALVARQEPPACRDGPTGRCVGWKQAEDSLRSHHLYTSISSARETRMFGGYLLTGVGLALLVTLIIVFLERQRREWARLDQDRIQRRRRRRTH